jgi:hypothetical protein
MMKTKQIVTRALAFTLGLASSPGMGGEANVTMKPLMAMSHTSGKKHILSFFVNRRMTCDLTVMVSALENDQPEAPDSRMQMVLDPFKSSRLDIADGKSLEFVCDQSALTMTVRIVDRISLLQEH